MMEKYQVVCRHCKRTFKDGFSATQATDCAASFVRGVVYGHYGSKHDASAIRVPFADTASEMMDPVCDNCIDAWIAMGGIEIKEWMDFEQPGPVHEWERGTHGPKN